MSEVTMFPVQTGSLPTIPVSDGAAVSAVLGAVEITDGYGNPTIVFSAASSPQAVGFGSALQAASAQFAYNGSTFDAVRNNIIGTWLASATRTATAVTPTLTNTSASQIIAFLNVTAASGTGGLQVEIQAQDPASGNWQGINAVPAAVTTPGLFAYAVLANTGANMTQVTAGSVPRTVRVEVVAGDASSYTYSLGYALIK